MKVYYSRYVNKETNVQCFKRLVVKPVDCGFRVFQETERGFGQGIVAVAIPSLKVYKTEKGAQKAMLKYEPKQYLVTLYEGLVLEGRI
jgi:hypothetical protein